MFYLKMNETESKQKSEFAAATSLGTRAWVWNLLTACVSKNLVIKQLRYDIIISLQSSSNRCYISKGTYVTRSTVRMSSHVMRCVMSLHRVLAGSMIRWSVAHARTHKGGRARTIVKINLFRAMTSLPVRLPPVSNDVGGYLMICHDTGCKLWCSAQRFQHRAGYILYILRVCIIKCKITSSSHRFSYANFHFSQKFLIL